MLKLNLELIKKKKKNSEKDKRWEKLTESCISRKISS